MSALTLDQQIVNAGGLIALLLVFVFAFFAALLPNFETARFQSIPAAVDDIHSLVGRLSTYRALAWSLFGVVVLVLALLGPLTRRDLGSQIWNPFDTLRAGLLFVDVLLIATGAGLLVEIWLMKKRRIELKEEIARLEAVSPS
jgi:hypothetical protein